MARSFVQLSFDERRIIARMHEKKFSQAEIARALQWDRPTICREIRRNFWHDDDVPLAEGYWHMTAHRMAMDRRRRYRKLLCDPHLCAAVFDRLKDGWSPAQISGRLKLSSGSSARLSHETIYQYVYRRKARISNWPGTCLSVVANDDRDMHADQESLFFKASAPSETDLRRSILAANFVTGKRI
jgi:IS30 family transposase